MQTLTRKQKQVLDFINFYIEENGISPTIEEIRKKLKLKAVSTIHEHVNNLKRKGYVLKDLNSVRGITPQNHLKAVFSIPIIGTIAAGKPIEAIEDFQESVSVSNPSIKNPKDYYALRVQGDSMIGEGIFDGDTVVIKKQSIAENGQTVVAIIDSNQATLKKLYREKNRFRLEPRNPAMLPLFRKDVEVRGVVVQIISNISKSPEAKTIKKTKLKPKTIDLFAGVGGIRLGFERAGFETVFANDFDEPCKITYDFNFPRTKLVVEDIRKIGIEDLPEFDFLLAGFPCQAFSIAGHRQGFNDEKGRGNLFFDIARIIEAKKPEGFLLENVKNLKSHDGGKTFKIIEETLLNLGYHVKTRVLNSMDYGNIPQNRERIYMVGFKNPEYAEKFSFPEPVKLAKKITDLLEKDVPEKYYYNDKPLFQKLKNFVKEEAKVYQWRRQYVRENKSGVCPTLTANMGMGGHNVPIIKDEKGIRKLTPSECFRIQGFPPEFHLPKISDSALYKQAGNSVSVPVIEAVAKQMMKVISN
ncbi:MAG: transcriptional repressor LexA [Candidatus Staskawiczbacteria bacterium]|nr:transcriptional repressor LexA [Candidatus Staskawiczbacteria bacterium]